MSASPLSHPSQIPLLPAQHESNVELQQRREVERERGRSRRQCIFFSVRWDEF